MAPSFLAKVSSFANKHVLFVYLSYASRALLPGKLGHLKPFVFIDRWSGFLLLLPVSILDMSSLVGQVNQTKQMQLEGTPCQDGFVTFIVGNVQVLIV